MPMRGRALVVADEAQLRSASADPSLGIWVYRARLVRDEPDLAADWFVAYGTKLPPSAQADAMTEWIVARAAARRSASATVKASPQQPVAPAPAPLTAAPAPVTSAPARPRRAAR